jgi:Rieske 2Fe-2S family protein
MHLAFSPISHVVACNDFAILFQFTPRTATLTDVDISWIVGAKAENPDVAKMVWAWDVTTVQDRQITEDNQAGIQSKHYIPGRYSDQERGVVNFQSWYLNQFGLQRAD